MMFDTRGAKRAAGLKLAESSTELVLASQMGKLPVGELEQSIGQSGMLMHSGQQCGPAHSEPATAILGRVCYT